MKAGLSLQELAAEITRRADKKEDFVADTRTLAYLPESNRLSLTSTGNAFEVNEHAHSQIADHTGIPATYYKRMKEDAPERGGRSRPQRCARRLADR